MSNVSSLHKSDWVERRPGGPFGSYFARTLTPSSPEVRPQPRRVVTPADFAGFPEPIAGKGTPLGFYDWYDWAVAWRYWNRDAAGLRRLYLLEAGELLRLGAELPAPELAIVMRVSERTVLRWQALLRPVAR